MEQRNRSFKNLGCVVLVLFLVMWVVLTAIFFSGSQAAVPVLGQLASGIGDVNPETVEQAASGMTPLLIFASAFQGCVFTIVILGFGFGALMLLSFFVGSKKNEKTE